MPDQSQQQPAAFNCEGGLVLNKSTFLMQPGEALELRNFEPDIEGGYRRINGFSKYVSAVVPFTSTSSEKVLMVASFADVVLAARGTSIYSATPGGSSWTSRDSGRTSAGKYTFERFNFDGTDKIVVVDGVNAPTVFNSSLAATDVSESTVSGSKFVASFKNHMFYAGKSTTKQEVIFSEPFDEDAFVGGQGAGSFKVDDTVVGLKVFRDDLFIVCETRIFKLTGTSSANFAVTSVTRNIGCVNGDTIQEFAGDLIFLGPDGLRTIAGTARIGDVELGTISSNVQSIFRENQAKYFDDLITQLEEKLPKPNQQWIDDIHDPIEAQIEKIKEQKYNLSNSNVGFDAYRSLAGEVEARTTQSRLNLDPQQRRENYPFDYKTYGYDVPAKSQTVDFGNNKANAQRPLTEFEQAHLTAQRGAIGTLSTDDDLRALARFNQMDDVYKFDNSHEYYDPIDKLVARNLSDDSFDFMELPTSYGKMSITPSAKEQGKWQVTQWAKDGNPLSDSGNLTKEKALRVFFEDSRPELLSPPKRPLTEFEQAHATAQSAKLAPTTALGAYMYNEKRKKSQGNQ